MKTVYADSMQYCEEARLDTQRLINLFQESHYQNSYVYTKDINRADFLLYNACGHLESKQDESINDIKKLLRLKKSSAKLIVWGCLPKINPASLREVYDGPMIGPEESWEFFIRYFNLTKKEPLDVYANSLNRCHISKHKAKEPLSRKDKLTRIYELFQFQRNRLSNYEKGRSQKNMWYIKIVSGCKNNCTYCSDRLAYKSVRSQPIEKIIEQFELGLSKGYRYFLFVGRDLGSYGCDLGVTLPNLMDAILLKHGKKDFNICLTQISPESLIHIFPLLKRALASGKIFCLGSHIQSGSSRILKLMGKNFSLDKWVEIIRYIERNYPKISLETSIMVGFPSETDQDFEKSVNLLNYLHFDQINLYKYNERPNLPSLRIKGRVPEKVLTQRYNEMLKYVTLFKARKRIKTAKIFKVITLNSLFEVVLVRLRTLLQRHFFINDNV